jgi:hypothetical protein
MWILKQGVVRNLKTRGMKFKRHTAEYSLLDHRRSEDISE